MTTFRFPKIPKRVWSIIGPLKIERKKNLQDDNGESLYGLWDNCARTIWLDADQRRDDDWRCLVHEWVHSVIADSNTQLTIKQEEDVCKALGNAIVAQALYGPTFLSLGAAKRPYATGRAPQPRPLARSASVGRPSGIGEPRASAGSRVCPRTEDLPHPPEETSPVPTYGD